jgi:hypothetical protein
MAQEITTVVAKTNDLLFDPPAKALEVAASSLQANTKLLQDVIELGTASLQAGRRYVEAFQQASTSGSDALIELGLASSKAALKWVESVQTTLRPRA